MNTVAKTFRTSAIIGAVVLESAMFAVDALSLSSGSSRVSVPVQLTSNDVGLVMGGTGTPTPTESYVDAAAYLYLQPNGFDGTPEALTTPELFGNREFSETQGAADLTSAIQQKIADGDVSPDNPLYVFGYSQSSALSAQSMHELHSAGVPSDDVHFVLVGDPSAPNGGVYTEFGVNGVAGTSDLTPDHLYPTDVYTLEYDGVADWPKYSSNLLSDLNAVDGLFFEHLAYLGLTPEQIADAVPLETVGDSMTHYFMIPSETLPLLDPLLLIPVVGKPLYDLLEPDARILVDLGYGSITDGWNDGPANVVSTVSFAPPDMNWAEVSTALYQGAEQGFAAFIADLANPSTYQLEPLVDNPALSELIAAGYGQGPIDTAAALHPDLILGVLDAWAGAIDPLTHLGFYVSPKCPPRCTRIPINSHARFTLFFTAINVVNGIWATLRAMASTVPSSSSRA